MLAANKHKSHPTTNRLLIITVKKMATLTSLSKYLKSLKNSKSKKKLSESTISHWNLGTPKLLKRPQTMHPAKTTQFPEMELLCLQSFVILTTQQISLACLAKQEIKVQLPLGKCHLRLWEFKTNKKINNQMQQLSQDFQIYWNKNGI